MQLRFAIAQNAPNGLTPVTFGNTPVGQSISDLCANSLAFTTENGNVNVLAPTAAGVEISGRVTTPDGRGPANVTVSTTDASGVVKAARTSSFGYYSFEGVEAGSSVVLNVESRRYRFAPRIVQVIDTLTDVDFQGQE